MAWLTYMSFGLLLYPVFKITVMLFSIPLAMLGAWLYGYKGAFFTAILTIPYHFIMLAVHTNDFMIIMEAVNIFGIATQLIFSLSTALLGVNQEKYLKLNSSLEKIVADRTAELRQLADYLIAAGESERSKLERDLIEGVKNSLSTMRETRAELESCFEELQRSDTKEILEINNLIKTCITQLENLESPSLTDTTDSFDLKTSITHLVAYFKKTAQIEINTHMTADCRQLDNDTAHDIYRIIHEAITNALRHAGAAHILIGMEQDEHACCIFIENDGHPMPEVFTKGMGIHLMNHRAKRINSSLNITNNPEGLTRVECRIPLSG